MEMEGGGGGEGGPRRSARSRIVSRKFVEAMGGLSTVTNGVLGTTAPIVPSLLGKRKRSENPRTRGLKRKAELELNKKEEEVKKKKVEEKSPPPPSLKAKDEEGKRNDGSFVIGPFMVDDPNCIIGALPSPSSSGRPLFGIDGKPEMCSVCLVYPMRGYLMPIDHIHHRLHNGMVTQHEWRMCSSPYTRTCGKPVMALAGLRPVVRMMDGGHLMLPSTDKKDVVMKPFMNLPPVFPVGRLEENEDQDLVQSMLYEFNKTNGLGLAETKIASKYYEKRIVQVINEHQSRKEEGGGSSVAE